MKILSLLTLALSANVNAATTNDPYYFQQWSLQNDGTQIEYIDESQKDQIHTISQVAKAGVDIGWAAAQAKVKAATLSPVIVAVIDGGVDTSHPDLQGRLSPDGYDFLFATDKMSDQDGHGTHTTGIIAANGDNGIGITGIAPSAVKVMPLRVLLDKNGYTNFTYKGHFLADYTADAIHWAIAHHASIINMSLGWPKLVDTANARAAVQDAVKAGLLVVVAAGNDHKDEPTFPCSYEGVLCVGSVSNIGETSVFSDFGGYVDLIAPGDFILSTYPTDVDSENFGIQGYDQLQGTSEAAPHITAIAATLKSMYPNMTANEMKARLLLSAGALPAANTSLYGMANLDRAISAVPQPVFLPDFKAIDHVILDESAMQVSGQITVSNLWANAIGVNTQIVINNEVVGTLASATFAGGSTITVPWTYHIKTMDQDSSLNISVKIAPRMGALRTFSSRIPIVRNITQMPGTEFVPIAGAKADDWIGLKNLTLYSKYYLVDTYPKKSGRPIYYQQISSDDNEGVMQVFDSTTVKTVHVPGVLGISEVMRIDHNQDGKMDWLVIGGGNTKGKDGAKNGGVNYMEFYFMDENFNPLYKTETASKWQVFSNYGQQIFQAYSMAGSWISVNGQLLPSFLGFGYAPPADNFGGQDKRAYRQDEHLYYLAPVATQPTNLNKATAFEVRVADTAAIHQKYPGLLLKTIVPPSTAEAAAGKIRVLVALGGIQNSSELNTKTGIWELGGDIHVEDNWNALSSSGTPYYATTDDMKQSPIGLVNYFDGTRANVSWSNEKGQWLDENNFNFDKLENPMLGTVGLFEINDTPNTKDRYWFIQTNFDIVGFHETLTSAGAKIEQQMVQLHRDSSFSQQNFSQLLTPIMVGESGRSLPAVYIDSTLVRGNEVSVLVWDKLQGGLSKPIKYSMEIPEGCVQMAPVHLNDQSSSYTLPMFCKTASGGVEYRLATP